MPIIVEDAIHLRVHRGVVSVVLIVVEGNEIGSIVTSAEELVWH